MRNKNQNLKTEIVETATKLFYDQGFNTTTYAQMANLLDISTGSLSYYFESKAHLGQQVYYNYTSRNNELIMQKMIDTFGVYDPLMGIAINIRLNLLMCKEDRKIFLFYYDLAKENIDVFLHTTSVTYVKSSPKAKPLNAEMDEEAILLCALKGTSIALTIAYFNGDFNTTYEYFADYKLKLNLKILNIPDPQIEKLVQESKTVFQQLNFKIYPYFVVK